MKSRVLALLLVLALLTAAPSAAAAQTNDPAQPAATTDAQDWQDLQDLKPGTRILVEFKQTISDPAEGKFVSAIGTKLTLTTDGDTRSFEQRDIQSVYQLKGKLSRFAAGGIGAVIGFFAGGFIGGAIVARQEEGPEPNILPIAGGEILGGIAGASIGRRLGGKRKGKLLYEAK